MSNLWTPRGMHNKQKKHVWHTMYSPLNDPTIRAQYPHAAANTQKSEAYYDDSGLHVILTEETHPPDDRHWQHVSVSREDRYPTWEEILAVKEEFIGEEEEAYQVLPRASQYVNIHPNVFHLWHCLDGDIMPN